MPGDNYLVLYPNGYLTKMLKFEKVKEYLNEIELECVFNTDGYKIYKSLKANNERNI